MSTTGSRERKQPRPVEGYPMVQVSFAKAPTEREQVAAWWQTQGRLALLSLSLAALTGCVADAKAEEIHRHDWRAAGAPVMRSCCVYRERNAAGEMVCGKKGLASCTPKICAGCPETAESCTGCMAVD